MNLKLARMQKGLNQRELAKIVGVHPALISQYEHNKRQPSVKTAMKIADVLEIEWTSFFEGKYDRLKQKTEQM